METRKLLDVTIGNNMAELRKKSNFTQAEVCSVVGVNCSTYKHYELGDRRTPISVIRDLAKFYKVSTDYFFENMPELPWLEKNQYIRTASSARDNISYFVPDLNNPLKLSNELEDKAQARARLRMKNLRLENNKIQKEVAKYLKIGLSTYNKYEKGSRKLSNEVVKKIAEYYNVSVSDIVD